MTRHIWLVAATAAIFTLQAPLCALACVEANEASVASPSAGADQHPCHEEGTAAGSDEQPSSHIACGCEFSSTALLPQPTDATSTASRVPPPAIVWDPVAPTLHWESRTAHETDLPPPDILRLHSTLLI